MKINDLEKKFLELVKCDYEKVMEEVQPLMHLASESITKAQKILQEYGFSAEFDVSPLRQVFYADFDKLADKYKEQLQELKDQYKQNNPLNKNVTVYKSIFDRPDDAGHIFTELDLVSKYYDLFGYDDYPLIGGVNRYSEWEHSAVC